MKAARSFDVWLDQGQNSAAPVLVGRAFLTTDRKSVSSSFTYDASYLEQGPTGSAFQLDPALPLFTGQHVVANRIVGAFSDSAPDRWGRSLIGKRLHAIDLEEGRTRRTATEADYLLGVTDLTRQGALRFSEPDAPMASNPLA